MCPADGGAGGGGQGARGAQGGAGGGRAVVARLLRRAQAAAQDASQPGVSKKVVKMESPRVCDQKKYSILTPT